MQDIWSGCNKCTRLNLSLASSNSTVCRRWPPYRNHRPVYNKLCRQLPLLSTKLNLLKNRSRIHPCLVRIYLLKWSTTHKVHWMLASKWKKLISCLSLFSRIIAAVPTVAYFSNRFHQASTMHPCRSHLYHQWAVVQVRVMLCSKHHSLCNKKNTNRLNGSQLTYALVTHCPRWSQASTVKIT